MKHLSICILIIRSDIMLRLLWMRCLELQTFAMTSHALNAILKTSIEKRMVTLKISSFTILKPIIMQSITPAMAAGLTDGVWTMEELLSYRVPPDFRDRLDQQATNHTS